MAALKRHRTTALAGAAIAILAICAWSASEAFAQKPGASLHDQAKNAGGKLVLRYEADRSVIYPNVEELAKRSDIIIVGHTVTHRSRIRADGKFITKDFWVTVQEVMKGDVRRGSTILLSLPGGSYRFPDDTCVFVKPRRYKPAEDGRIYVFFLRNKGTTYKGYELAGGVQGQFDITGVRVEPADILETDPVMSKYKEKSSSDFLVEIHRAVSSNGKP